jgi:hypothetical protein
VVDNIMDELLDELRILIIERQNIIDLITNADAGKVIEHTFDSDPLFANEMGQLKGAIAAALNQYKTKINQLIRAKIREIIT